MFDLIENKLVPRTEIDEEHRNEIFDVEAKEWIDPRILIMVGTKWFRYCEQIVQNGTIEQRQGRQL